MKIELGSDWFESKSEEWVIPGLVCDSLTLISGEPKSGKTSLACHIVKSLIQGTDILGIKPNAQNTIVAWMGFDFHWDRELKARLPEIYKQLYFVGPLHSTQVDEWEKLMGDLSEKGVTLLVIDHLYGLGSTAELDKQAQVQNVLTPIYIICRNYGIAVILLTQASRTGTGRAAHSVAIEGMARWLIRIKGTGKTRIIETLGNNGAQVNFKVRLNPNELYLINQKVDEEAAKKPADGQLPERARYIVKNAPPEARLTPKKLGIWLASQGLGIKTNEAGRAATYDLLNAELLNRDSSTGEITAGPKLLTSLADV